MGGHLSLHRLVKNIVHWVTSVFILGPTTHKPLVSVFIRPAVCVCVSPIILGPTNTLCGIKYIQQIDILLTLSGHLNLNP